MSGPVAPDIEPAIIVDAPNVNIDRSRQRRIGEDRQDAMVSQARADRLDDVRVSAQQHDVVYLFHGWVGEVRHGNDLDPQSLGAFLQPAGKIGGHVGQQQSGRS